MIDIIAFSSEHWAMVKILNYEWLEQYFSIEPNDKIQLEDPENEILAKGGLIFYTRYNGEIAGTVSLLKISDDVYELGIMATSADYQGKGIGNKLVESSINKANELSAAKLVLYSNTKLVNAIHLYEKFGFKEVPMGVTHYSRSDIKMELNLK